jgi:hypothetical protein
LSNRPPLSPIPRIEDTHGFDTLAVCHVLIHPIALPPNQMPTPWTIAMWKNEATAINARRASLVAQTTIEVSPAAWQTVAPAGPARSAGPRRQVRAIGMILILGFSAKRPEDGSRRSWGRASAPLSRRERANLAAVDETAPNRAVSMAADILPPDPMPATSVPALTPAGQAALDAAQVLARKATAPATLRAYKADWSHFAEWCAAHGFVPVPAAPTTVGAYLASLAGSHAPTTIRRRLSALGKMHRFNDLAWNPAHRDIPGRCKACCARMAARCKRPRR